MAQSVVPHKELDDRLSLRLDRLVSASQVVDVRYRDQNTPEPVHWLSYRRQPLSPFRVLYEAWVNDPVYGTRSLGRVLLVDDNGRTVYEVEGDFFGPIVRLVEAQWQQEPHPTSSDLVGHDDASIVLPRGLEAQLCQMYHGDELRQARKAVFMRLNAYKVREMVAVIHWSESTLNRLFRALNLPAKRRKKAVTNN